MKRQYKVTYETVGRGTTWVRAESVDEAAGLAPGPLIAIEMLPLLRSEQGELWSEAVRGGRGERAAFVTADTYFRGLIRDAAEASERFGDDELERYAQAMHEKPDIHAVEAAIDYADWTESELRFADGDR